MAEAQRLQKPIENQRTRGPKLAVLVKRANGVPFEEGLRIANNSKAAITSNKRMDKALHSGEWRQVEEGLWCWTGTMTAYKEPDRELGKKIEYTDPETGYRWVFNVPKEYQNKKNAILVAEHPDYTLETDGNNRVIHVPEDKVGIVLAFPASDGWNLTDPLYGIPTTKGGDESAGERYLWRIDKRVGPVARDGFVYYNGNFVDLGNRPSDARGVVVEAASGGAPSEAASPDIKITEGNGKLVVEGTPEQLAEAKRKLEG